ncbi:MAG TPA: hypothetical protein VF174_06580 [Micromonosporaceae bacterium]
MAENRDERGQVDPATLRAAEHTIAERAEAERAGEQADHRRISQEQHRRAKRRRDL